MKNNNWILWGRLGIVFSLFLILGMPLENLQAQMASLHRPHQLKQTAAETVSGVVTDAETNETLPGVNIAVKGTSLGAFTDSLGRYAVEPPSLNDTLVVSYVGYSTRQIPINGRTEINIQLSPTTLTGEELVVVGYGTQRAEELTGSVSRVQASPG